MDIGEQRYQWPNGRSVPPVPNERQVAMRRKTRRVTASVATTAVAVLLATGLGTASANAQTAPPDASPSTVISTVAGSGGAGFGGDGGPATSARLTLPTGVAEDVAGSLYIADTLNFRVRKVTTSGVISTVAGSGIPGFGGDGGPATRARLFAPESPALDAAGNLYIADSGNNRIRRVNTSGVIDTVAGTGACGRGGDNGLATQGQLCAPTAVAVDGKGNVYIADTGNNEIRKVTPTGTISTFAGTGLYGASGDGGPATSARLGLPKGVAVDSLHNVLIADAGNNRIRKVDPYGVISTLAGTGRAGFGGDGGPATLAKLNHPSGLGIDPLGNVYIVDSFNFRVRVLIPKGDILTYAGTGSPGFSGDGGPASAARMNIAFGDLAVDANNVFLTDTVNERVRSIHGGPPPNIPEVPFAIILPLSAAALIGGWYLVARRRRRRTEVAV